VISGLVATDLEGPDPLTDDGTPLCSQPYSPTHRSEEPDYARAVCTRRFELRRKEMPAQLAETSLKFA
jgi:hypothetical protein